MPDAATHTLIDPQIAKYFAMQKAAGPYYAFDDGIGNGVIARHFGGSAECGHAGRPQRHDRDPTVYRLIDPVARVQPRLHSVERGIRRHRSRRNE